MKNGTSVKIRALAAAGCILLPGAAAQAQTSEAPACDRACLEGHVDRYLDALVARDPNLLPLAPDVKFTENGVELVPGDAAWGTVTGLGQYKMYVADPEAGEIGFMGVVIENQDYPGVMALRLKVEDGRISEIETLWKRDPEAAARLEARGAPRAHYTTALPASQRPTREQLVATANMYFTGLHNNDGTRYTPFTEDCMRLEDGMQTTSREGGTGFSYMDCDQQFRSGYFLVDTDMRERRFRVVDRERGVVFAFVFFDHDATFVEYQLTTGETIQSRYVTPHTWAIAEVFKIVDGKISQIEAIMNEVPYGMSSGWYDCSGPFPVPCNQPGPPQRNIRLGHDYPENR